MRFLCLELRIVPRSNSREKYMTSKVKDRGIMHYLLFSRLACLLVRLVGLVGVDVCVDCCTAAPLTHSLTHYVAQPLLSLLSRRVATPPLLHPLTHSLTHSFTHYEQTRSNHPLPLLLGDQHSLPHSLTLQSSPPRTRRVFL